MDGKMDTLGRGTRRAVFCVLNRDVYYLGYPEEETALGESLAQPARSPQAWDPALTLNFCDLEEFLSPLWASVASYL